MTLKYKTILYLITILSISQVYSQKQSVTNDSLKIYFKEIKKANKNLFLVFSAPNCLWCEAMSNYHKDSTVKAILSKYFIIKTMNIKQSKAAMDLYEANGKQGTPFWIIYDSKEKWITNSDNGKGNIGYPVKEEEIIHYLSSIKKIIPSISQQECNILVTKLKEYNPKK